MRNPELLRVLHVTPGLAPRVGGPTKAALGMCEALARRGLDVSLFTTNLDNLTGWLGTPTVLPVPTNRSICSNGVSIRYFPTRWPHRFGFSPAMAGELRRQVPTFDVIHVHSLYLFSSLAASHYARRFRIPYLVRPHGTLDPFIRRRHRLRKAIYTHLFEQRDLDHAAAIHYTSENEMQMARSIGIKAPAAVVPLGLDIAEFDHLPPRGLFRQHHPALRDRRLIVFVSRLAPKKGLDLLVKAFAQIADRFPDTHLIIAGPDDVGYGTTVQDLLLREGLEHRSTLLGMVLGQQKRALLADTDVWVLPSYTENFGFAAIEALACGLPVIISDRVDVHEQVSAASAGLVVPCDVLAVAGAMADLLSDPQLCKRLGQAARQLVRSQFSWDTAADKLITVYAEIASRKQNQAVSASG